MGKLVHRLERAVGMAVFAVVGMLALGVVAEASNNNGQNTIPLIVQNKSKLSANLFVYVQGVDNGQTYFVTDRQGNTKLMAATTGYEAFGFKLGKGEKSRFRIPQFSAGRIYFSFARKMKIEATSNSAYSTPVGWSKSDPNFKTLFDWVEYTWTASGKPGPSFNANATQVDMLGFPMFVRLKGIDANKSPTVTKAGFHRARSRHQIIANLRKAGKPWSKLVVDGRNKRIPRRIISPYNGMSFGTFPDTQLDNYITRVFNTYTRATMIAKTNANGTDASFTGQVTSNSLVFSRVGSPASTVSFAKPSTLQAYQGYLGTLSSNPSQLLRAQAAQIATYIQAGFMRTTIDASKTVSACPGTTAYYKKAPVNVYAKVIHKHAYQHLAYAFGWDDMCSQASDNTVFDPKWVAIKILPIK